MLVDVIHQIQVISTSGDLAVPFAGVTADSRDVGKDDVFVACPGQRADGRDFIRDAIAAGAAAVVCEPPPPDDLPAPVILVEDARVALAELASALHDHPSRRIGLVGITGTDGKTTTTHLVAAILNEAGIRAGLISTIAVGVSGSLERNRSLHTTPPAPIIQEQLARMSGEGVQVAVLEVSSHALVTARVHGCVFDCAVFTNLDPEHLDFHGTLLNYRAAKAKLFAQLDRGPAKPWGRLAVVNRDDPNSSAMRSASSAPCIEYGLSSQAAIRAEIISYGLDGTTFRLITPDGDGEIRTRLPGRHNVLNWLAATAASRHFGATIDDVRRAAAEFSSVPGRLESIDQGQPFKVYVDFAHTPQALAATTDVLRRYSWGRLIVLFGQAGHRDRANRRRMANAVVERADLAIITSDDPYDEDPQEIVDDLARWMRQAGWREGRQFWRIVDREKAIHFAIEMAEAGDCVLLAGRGPEDETVIAGERVPLVDGDVARAALARRGEPSRRS